MHSMCPGYYHDELILLVRMQLDLVRVADSEVGRELEALH